MSHQTFWKPEKKVKEKKSFSSLGQRKKSKKPIPDWKKDIFAHHQSRPSRADRAEFPPEVVKELIEETDGLCQCNCGRNATQTHHVMPRGRSGRGVKTNAMRVCDACHDRIQTNEEELQGWISTYSLIHGPRFWFDEQDWEEFNRKQAAMERIEAEKKERLESIKPIVELIASAAGRSLKVKEIRLLEAMDAKQMSVFTTMISDALNNFSKPVPSYGYGERFED
ncbi:HNH endonuclease [Paenibacillus sp. Lou8.1]|uniref:HNH endonuclease n=1 Tax=Paenibacillus sp. Lou8.1 TaxID=2962041 RepID=UPI0020B6AAF1|nr:HNH endonuclease [Paenibacillus sp. Lou8.1]MCP3806437.1 HNH endonuclease [Paenibacillus sp. Lou8.1]